MKFNSWKIAVVILATTTLASAGTAAYFYRSYSALKADPQAAINEDVDELIAEVGDLMVLPAERPTVATVTDPEQLKNQAFFGSAKAGDKVLIYTGARKAILYDPVAGKIIEVAPLNVGDAAGATK